MKSLEARRPIRGLGLVPNEAAYRSGGDVVLGDLLRRMKAHKAKGNNDAYVSANSAVVDVFTAFSLEARSRYSRASRGNLARVEAAITQSSADAYYRFEANQARRAIDQYRKSVTGTDTSKDMEALRLMRELTLANGEMDLTTEYAKRITSLK